MDIARRREGCLTLFVISISRTVSFSLPAFAEPNSTFARPVKTYHAQAYTPQNTTLVLTGQALHPLRLLTTLVSSVEPNLPSHGPHPRGWKRPFLETSTASNPPQLYQDETDVVEYPEKDESVGEVQLHWIGPPARDYELAAALAVLGDYLSGSSISPLNKLFVENKDPAASGELRPFRRFSL